MNNLLLITGAGASYDCVDIDIIKTNIEKRPPLTKYLFFPDFYRSRAGGERKIIDNGECSYVHECLKSHMVASKIGLGYKMHVQNHKEEGLEKYLYNMKTDKKILIKNQFWSVPIYLHSLFTEISKNYIPTTQQPISTNYKLLIEEINNSGYNQIIWLNLNYDLLADFAITHSVTGKKLDNMANYMKLETPDGLKIKYTKPHGSIDWYKQIDHSELSRYLTWDSIADNPTTLPIDFESRLSRAVYTEQEWSNLRRAGERIERYPAITAPLGEYEYVCGSHIEEIKKELENTTSILCIGFSAFDEDILKLIKQNISRIDKLKIVNGSLRDSKEAYARLSRHYEKKINITEETAAYDDGFTKFIKKEIRSWLSQ